jgi:hypothetical protein
MKNYVTVDYDGWVAFYLNGELITQDDEDNVQDVMNDEFKNGYDSVKEVYYDDPQDYMEQHGEFPEKLDDLPGWDDE